MKNLLLFVSLVAIIPLFSGCAMCCGTHDYAYPAYGGKWERGDRFWGRVGSPLSGAGTTADGYSGGGEGYYYEESGPQFPMEGEEIILTPQTGTY